MGWVQLCLFWGSRRYRLQRGGGAMISEAPVKVFATKFILGIFIVGISKSLHEYELCDKNWATILHFSKWTWWFCVIYGTVVADQPARCAISSNQPPGRTLPTPPRSPRPLSSLVSQCHYLNEDMLDFRFIHPGLGTMLADIEMRTETWLWYIMIRNYCNGGTGCHFTFGNLVDDWLSKCDFYTA